MLLHSAFLFIHNWPSSLLIPIALFLPLPFTAYLQTDQNGRQHANTMTMPGQPPVDGRSFPVPAPTGAAPAHQQQPHQQTKCTCNCACNTCKPVAKSCSPAPPAMPQGVPVHQAAQCCPPSTTVHQGVHAHQAHQVHQGAAAYQAAQCCPPATVHSHSNAHLNTAHHVHSNNDVHTHSSVHLNAAPHVHGNGDVHFQTMGYHGHGHSHVEVSESQATCGNATTHVTTHTHHIQVHEHLNHDVCFSLHQLNALTLPPVQYSSAAHPPVHPCPVKAAIPTVFKFDARLIRDELHHPLLCYLAEGVQPSLFNTGVGTHCGTPVGSAATKIVSGRQLLAVERPDGYRGLQCVAYGTLLLSINAALLEESARNACIDGKRLWSISAPCGSPCSAALECRVGGVASVAVELHPTNVVSNAMIERVLHLVKAGASYDPASGRAFAPFVDGCPILHSDALTLLSQVWARFGRESLRKDASCAWLVLTNLERALVFRRSGNEIRVSHVIHANGTSTPRDSVQNIYCLFLALAVLEKHQYCPPAHVDIVHLI